MGQERVEPEEATSSGGALAGIKVVDLTRILGGPYATQLLADHGAEVIKVEPPQGDDTRLWGPPFVDDVAAYFQGINRNKRAIMLDLAQASGREMLLALLENADVIIENFKPGTLERWGLGYAGVLSKRFPALIHCQISGFGGDGPLGGLPGYDAILQAMTGLMSVNGEQGGPPLRIGVPIVDMVTGLNAAIGILLALQERTRSGRGQSIEATLFDSAVSLLHPHLANYLASNDLPKRSGNAHPNITPYDVFDTRTLPIFLSVGNNEQFRLFCEKIGQSKLADRSEFASNADRNANRVALRAVLAPILLTMDGRALADDLIRSGVPCGPVLDISDMLEHPHTTHRNMIVSVADYRGAASPIKLGRTPASYRSPPPRFDQDGEAIRELCQPKS